MTQRPGIWNAAMNIIKPENPKKLSPFSIDTYSEFDIADLQMDWKGSSNSVS